MDDHLCESCKNNEPVLNKNEDIDHTCYIYGFKTCDKTVKSCENYDRNDNNFCSTS